MRPSERLSAAFLAALSAAAALGAPRDAAALAVPAGLAAAVVLLSRADGGPGRAVRDFLPVVVVIAVFMVLEPVIAGLNPRRWDDVLAAWDGRWLGGLVPAWRGVLGRAPAFVDAVYLVYVSYYLLPVAAALAARRRGPEAFERAMFALLLCFYASFAGYLLVPAAGPRLPVADEARVLGGGAVSASVRAFLAWAERTRLDAFPSGHTAIGLVSAWVGTRAAPRSWPAFAGWALAVVFSTVYVHVHYAVDVLAGAALAAAVLSGANAVARALGGAASRTATPPPAGTS